MLTAILLQRRISHGARIQVRQRAVGNLPRDIIVGLVIIHEDLDHGRTRTSEGREAVVVRAGKCDALGGVLDQIPLQLPCVGDVVWLRIGRRVCEPRGKGLISGAFIKMSVSIGNDRPFCMLTASSVAKAGPGEHVFNGW